MIDEWVDAEHIEAISWVIVVVLAVLALLVLLVLRKVAKFFWRMLLVLALVGAGVALWSERAALQDCVSTCSCELFGQSLEIPEEINPDCD